MIINENRLWRSAAPLVLASKSAARRSLLDSARVPVEAVAVEVDERQLDAEAAASGAGPSTVAAVLARAKAQAGSASHPGRLVLGADQTLALGDEAFHKPATTHDARIQIARLAGRTHALHSAIAVVKDGTVLFETVETAHLTMRPLGDEVIEAYIAAAGPAVMSSVGGYQLEGLGIHLFERVEGDHAVILGLPLLPLLAFLRRHGELV